MSKKKKLYNHISPTFSELEKRMVVCIPPGGNWKDIPESIPSQRLAQIRESGGRTTYYGRLKKDAPSYTISTYFNRMGNGCFIHPSQDRLISIREGARLQSFPDNYIFYGSKTSQYKQIGNAVPPLLAREVASLLEPYIKHKTFVDLFAGAGGMSLGFSMQGYKLLGAIEIEKKYFETYKMNHPELEEEHLITGDICLEENKQKLVEGLAEKPDVIVGGPPCQGFSTAGWRNPNDKRNQLFKEFVNIVDKVKPDFFVMENVPGILTMRKGDAFKEIIKSFEEIGYFVNEPIKLNAEEFGVPQKRKRIFIIGSKNGIVIKQPKPLFSTDSNIPNPITVEEAIYDLPTLGLADGDYCIEYNPNPQSPYQKLMNGLIDFNEFIQLMSNKRTLCNVG